MEWIPTRSSAKGRLVLDALEAFGAHGYDGANVAALAAAAGVTTGALYHHFGNKLGLYDVVRTEVERRVLDRLEGAVAARGGDTPVAAARTGLLVAFDHLIAQGYIRLLADPHPARLDDPIDAFVARTTDRRGVPVGRILVAAWRAALRAVSDGVPPGRARAALAAFGVDETALQSA